LGTIQYDYKSIAQPTTPYFRFFIKETHFDNISRKLFATTKLRIETSIDHDELEALHRGAPCELCDWEKLVELD
jgi:hypothetical protein